MQRCLRTAGEGGRGETALEADADRFVTQEGLDQRRRQRVPGAGRIDRLADRAG